LQHLFGFSDHWDFCEQHRQLVQDAIGKGGKRESCWTESIAVGSSRFIEETKVKLGIRANGGKIEKQEDRFVLREELSPYSVDLTPQKGLLSSENSYYLDD
jgi:hypothetical protein